MATFAVTTSDEIITRGKTLLERMARPGEKQGDVLDRMFRIIEEQEDGEAMKAQLEAVGATVELK